MWLLAVSLPLLPVIIVTMTRYWGSWEHYTSTFCVTCSPGDQQFASVVPTALCSRTAPMAGPRACWKPSTCMPGRTPSLSLGPQRGEFLDEVVQQVAPVWTLELGTHCGYSSVRILRLLPPGGQLLTVEHNPTTADAAEEIILVAGFKHSQFQLLSCPSEEAIARLRTHLGEGLLHLVLMDHNVGLYLSDLQALEFEGLLAPGCVLLFNNAHLPAAHSLLRHISSRPGQYTIQRQAHGLLELHCHQPANHSSQDQD